MEKLQQDIWELSQHVKKLNQAMEELPSRLIEAMARQSSVSAAQLEDTSIEHKDVLVDRSHSSWSDRVNDFEISSEWQIRRLTAQLTTAYNRIAALEEELLNRRMTTR